MQFLYFPLMAAALYPLGKAWRANRHTALAHAVGWGWAAWSTWLLTFICGGNGLLGPYCALSLTGCAGVAVLGARRPHVGAWDFVVLSLLAVLLLPIAQGWGKPVLSPPYLAFLGVTVAFGWLNYLPTRFFPAVLLFGLVLGVEFARLCGMSMDDWLLAGSRCLLALSPWLALLGSNRNEVSAVERVWLEFRDRFGVVWGQRAREQFNRAAANAHWPVALSWQGLDVEPGHASPPEEELLATLQAVLKRFGGKEADA